MKSFDLNYTMTSFKQTLIRIRMLCVFVFGCVCVCSCLDVCVLLFERVRSCLDLHLRVWMCKCSCLDVCVRV